jgi:hypothetical protein
MKRSGFSTSMKLAVVSISLMILSVSCDLLGGGGALNVIDIRVPQAGQHVQVGDTIQLSPHFSPIG